MLTTTVLEGPKVALYGAQPEIMGAQPEIMGLGEDGLPILVPLAIGLGGLALIGIMIWASVKVANRVVDKL